MAKIKITGHTSGTGTITLTAPNTSTDRIVTLPDGTGTLLDENSSLPAANLTGTVAGFTSTGIDDNATSTAITIDSSENVGIGTASPITKLDASQDNIGGNVALGIFQSGNAYGNVASSASLYLGATYHSLANSAKITSTHSSGTTGNHAQDLTFNPINSGSTSFEAMRIDSSGNAGLGVTPESSYAGRPTLRIGSGLAIGGYGSGNPSHHWINANAYQDASTAAEKYIGTDQASQIKQTNGTIAFNVAPNGTAGAAITWDNAMVIDNDGHVGIGYSAVNGILDVRESWASKWAARFENTSATGLGILGISAATSGAYSLLELRKNETEVVLNIRADGKAISQFTAAAWVSIDGVGTVGINDSYNISSITDNGTGQYTINIDTNMLNSNYAVTAMCQGQNYNSAFACLHGTMSVGSFPIRVRTGPDSDYIDADEVMLTIFGDQ